jgi:uncharacterized protein YceH (UPF0502 family)
VVDYDDATLREALERLGRRGWTRLASGPGSRAPKYRHLLDEALGLDGPALSVLAVLMLRGPQTVAELKTRAERMHHFSDNAEVEATLRRLDEKELVHNIGKGPGQSAERWTHLISEGPTEEPEEAVAAGEPTSLERRLAQVEQRLDELERELAQRGVLD